MAQEAALAIVNTLHSQLATMARSIISALSDKKISPWEGMQLGMQGMQLATYVMTLLQGVDQATQVDLLYVLENGVVVLPGKVDGNMAMPMSNMQLPPLPPGMR